VTIRRRLSRLLELDSTLVFGLAAKLVSAVLAPLTTVIVALHLSPDLQGYYYTFISLTALQVFVELGLTGVVTTFASHEWSQLERSADGSIQGDQRALSRLASLSSFATRWFLGAACVIVCVFIAVGLNFLDNPQQAVAWKAPWVCLSIATGINIMFVPGFALLLGCGEVRKVNFYRFVETILRFAAIWSVLVAGGALWASVVSAGIAGTWTLVFFWNNYRPFFRSLQRAELMALVDWRQNILPLQWRTAVMWPSGYMMFSVFTPALFHYQGPVLAGQMGMSWALVSGLSGLASTWLQVRTPQFGALVARKEFALLDSIALKAGLTSFSVALLGTATIYVLLELMEQRFPWWRVRFLPTLPIMLFLSAEVVHQLSFAQSGYLRSFKREPFFWQSIVCGWGVGISTIVSAKYFGATSIALGYLFGIGVAVVWGSVTFVRCRRSWTI
jgi:hypothetical protein